MILKKVKDSLNELAALVPNNQTEVFKKHFSDVLEIVFETGCRDHCLFIDNKDFKSKAASNPRIHHKSSSIDSKGKECKHFTWRPANGEELNIIFTSEIADVSITWSSALFFLYLVPSHFLMTVLVAGCAVHEQIPKRVC